MKHTYPYNIAPFGLRQSIILLDFIFALSEHIFSVNS